LIIFFVLEASIVVSLIFCYEIMDLIDCSTMSPWWICRSGIALDFYFFFSPDFIKL